MAKVVKMIPSTINPMTMVPVGELRKKKVAAYARVSTDSDEQYTSYEMQVKYYSNFIQNKPDWEYVNVYADEGITGTSTKNREQFNTMIKDAKSGKIDLILTKSISRFARNTLDTISITRELRSRGIEIYFEKENLWSLDDKSEFLLTIMASIAQEESRSISQNVTLGKRWHMKEGHVSFAYSTFLGYKKEDGKIVVDEVQAQLVRLIYRMFLKDGKTATGIAEYLKSQGFKTPSGKGTNWTKNTVFSILTNEKYKGDALLQKTFVPDYLTHKAKKNTGEVNQYYVENSHPAIIDREEWDLVQIELARREKIGPSYSGNSVFSSKLICGDCGGFYGKKVWHAGTKHQKEIYRCNKKYNKGQEQCETPHVSEAEVKEKFIKAYNIAMTEKTRILKDIEELIEIITNTDDLDFKISAASSKMSTIAEMVEKLVRNNARTDEDQESFSRKYNELTKQYEQTKAELERASEDKAFKQGQVLKMKAYLETIRQAQEVLTEWSDDLWMTMVESATVNRDKTITFKFTSGKEVRL